MVNMLSFDIEEYFHGYLYRHINPADWSDQPSRLLDNMERLLDILGTQQATFFVVGWVAKHYPNLLRTLQALGHEIACHGYLHRHIAELTPRAFREDLLAAKQTIEDVICVTVSGFLAPTFSVVRDTLWVLPYLQEAGFTYDSSIFPIRHDRYGIPDFPRRPFKILDGLWEVPLSTLKFWKFNIPVGGGGYLRLYPYWLTRFLVNRLNSENLPLVFYQHAWELDDSRNNKIFHPKSRLASLRRAMPFGTPEAKLRKMLRDYKFVPIQKWLATVTG